MYVPRLSHKSYPEECNDGTELSSSAYVCDNDSYKIISLESHDSGSVLVDIEEHELAADEEEAGTTVTGSFCPVCKCWWDGTNTGQDKYALEPFYVHQS